MYNRPQPLVKHPSSQGADKGCKKTFTDLYIWNDFAKRNFHCMRGLWDEELGSEADNLDLPGDLDKVSKGTISFLLSYHSFWVHDSITTGV